MDILSQLRTGKLAQAKRLDLSAGLEEFPEEIFELAETLEILDLSGNALSSLPDDFRRLRKLRILFCSNNQFEHLPEVLGHCPQLSMIGFKANRICHVPAAALPSALRWLILTDNQVEELPASIGRCGDLQKLMLAGNRLHALPDAMAACKNLELLRIAANRFEALPAWLYTLPRLAWLAYAGNPLCESSEASALAQNPIDDIAWDSLEVQDKLGEGASGVIFKAFMQGIRQNNERSDRTVAVKLFKGAVTSDGLPRSEMTACIAAGVHPNIVAVEGKVHGHPDGTDGLVMSLIEPNFGNLAGPPSLESCTRDIYAADTRFTLDAALRIALGVASAVRRLHVRGIMHGDLYGHNILTNPEGDCLLGDFGAASFFSAHDRSPAEALQRIESRAFGCLLEELFQRCDAVPEISRNIHDAAWALQARCVQADTATRPLFGEIQEVLEDLRSRAAAAGLPVITR